MSKIPWDKIEKTKKCWNWLGKPNDQGYGRIGQKRAHRFVYMELVGEIPKGKELDHLCRNRKCVNPKHLEVVSHKENVRRGMAGKNKKAKVFCYRGHRFSVENTSIREKDGYKYQSCRKCSKINRENWYKKIKKLKKQQCK